jgi:hypothetical protein
MKKLIAIYAIAATMVYAACSNTHHSSTSNTSMQPATDTAMGGDAMKKDVEKP